ncbi:MAG: tRNA 2-selenouridine(34) synthase MnmH, partial [Halothiobacillaceae bacterium]
MNGALEQVGDFERLFVESVPLLDVRAPVEFAQGAFPGAENRPLLNDEERRQVGIRYKEQGQEAAIALGYRLVDEQEKQRRVALWQEFFARHPHGVLYCFRGGLRSRLTQQMLADAGVVAPRVRGGYKAMRRFLIGNLELIGREQPLMLLGGRTGVGKTDLLNRFDRAVDLEGIAAHRGSAFGKRARPQPAQIDIENTLSIELLRQRAVSRTLPVLLEDEGRAIGSREIPLTLFAGMSKAALVLVETGMDERVEQGLKDYVLDLQAEYRSMLPTAEADEAFAAHLRNALTRLQRRLGGVRHRQYLGLFEEALSAWLQQRDDAGLRLFIAGLLRDYYDPMYDYQIDRK